MDMDFPSRAQGMVRRRTPWGAIGGVVLGAFLLGGVATWGLLRSDDIALPELLSIKHEDASLATPEGAPAAAGAEEFAGQQGELDQRIGELEQRLARLNVQANAAAGNAARARAGVRAPATAYPRAAPRTARAARAKSSRRSPRSSRPRPAAA